MGKSSLAVVVLATLLTVSACGWSGFGDPDHAEYVLNYSDRTLVVCYEYPPEAGFSSSVSVPRYSSGVGLTDLGSTWHGVVVIMTTDCAPLGRFEIPATPSLLTIATDGTMSLSIGNIEGTGVSGAPYKETFNCTDTHPG